MLASNKVANYVVLILGSVATYFALVYFPVYWGNFQLKQAAREWIATSREKSYRERASQTFYKQARVLLDQTLPDDSCIYEASENVDGAKVTCEYIKNAEFYGTKKVQPIRFKWTVNQVFQKF